MKRKISQRLLLVPELQKIPAPKLKMWMTSIFALRLADGRSLVAKHRSIFDHPNGSGLQCLNIMLAVSNGDCATRVRLHGPADRCTLVMETEIAGLHVSHGPPGPNVVGSIVLFHANAPAGTSPLRPANDKWQLDRQQGTLSPCANTALVIGLTPGNQIGLVLRGSSSLKRSRRKK